MGEVVTQLESWGRDGRVDGGGEIEGGEIEGGGKSGRKDQPAKMNIPKMCLVALPKTQSVD